MTSTLITQTALPQVFGQAPETKIKISIIKKTKTKGGRKGIEKGEKEMENGISEGER